MFELEAFYLLKAYSMMLIRYGDPHWWPGETPFEVAVGAVLTQSTSWTSVERSIAALKDGGLLDLRTMHECDVEVLASAVRSTLYNNSKARCLKGLCSHIIDEWGGSLLDMANAGTEEVRSGLLSLKGIGPETADSILCYALAHPVLVVDAYTHRLLGRMSPSSHAAVIGGSRDRYGALQGRLMSEMEGDAPFYNRFHALIVMVCKDHCRKVPTCAPCPLSPVCSTGKTIISESLSRQRRTGEKGDESCQ